MKRRTFILLVGSCDAGGILPARLAFALGEEERHFIAEAARMKAQAVASGDQPFGAIVVKGGVIVGYGPSRVILDRNANAHAERVALTVGRAETNGHQRHDRRDHVLDLAALRCVQACLGARQFGSHVLRSGRYGRRKAATLSVDGASALLPARGDGNQRKTRPTPKANTARSALVTVLPSAE